MEGGRVREKKAVRTNRYTNIGITGRKTGVTIKSHIHQDEDGFDNVDDFFQSSASENESEEEEFANGDSRVTPDSPIPQDNHATEYEDSFVFSNASGSRVTKKSPNRPKSASRTFKSPDLSPEFPGVTDELPEYEETEPAYPEYEEPKVEKAKPRVKARKVTKPPTSHVERKARYARESDDDSNVRRSHRTRVKPVEFWKNERVVYELEKEGTNVVPVIREVVKAQENPSFNPVSRLPKRRVTKKATTQPKKAKDVAQDEPVLPIKVLEWGSNSETEKLLAVTQKEINPTQAKNQTYGFQKFFSEGEFMSSGVIEIYEGGSKPNRNSGDNSMVFYVISGACRVTIHNTTFDISTGGQFLIPRGNQYQIENIAPVELRLFFAQAREVVITSE
ncbi:hypothetical protein K493DRAFT_319237 [Basidiobolus meristosporus CBS 931.73]|uniref:CENP-C homolog n=1 Tax=Basidiobolus meristosporus CBS 931.73 TaxID=1314790 RepID=A0A1Y1XSM1_9FUNG|nr:hypothetical protein K493DRAFT_319237 [Basidiobolus meristosporus CBS 931.73]|eukprot:ORX88730.1 hypothetical protein K493DRAFT_319237 [Basidiobolus meristosporus CBS 931.73]